MIKDRRGNIISPDEGQERFLTFLYNNAAGKVLLKIISRKWISNLVSGYMNSRLSKGRIKKFIKNNNIDMSEYEEKDYYSFNGFFIRDIKKGARPTAGEDEAVIAPADSKLTVYEIGGDSKYVIKDCVYSIDQLLASKEEAEYYLGGYCCIYRLTADNYHHFGYVDGGTTVYSKFVPGEYHTVNPVALEKYDVYGKNCRKVNILDTNNFGRIAYIEVGAMLIGRITQTHDEKSFERGDEKGYFEFGGSTIVLLYKKGDVKFDEDITNNSADGIETAVKYGEKVGHKLN